MTQNISKLVAFIGLFGFVYLSFFTTMEDVPSFFLLVAIIIYVVITGMTSLRSKIQSPKIILFAIVAEILLYIVASYYASYSQFYSVKRFAVVLFLLMFFANGFSDESIFIRLCRISYWVLFCLSIYNISLNVVSNNFDVSFAGIGDRNYTAILIFMLFMMSYKLGYYSGSILGIVYALFFTDSRSFLLLIFLFYITKIWIENKNNIKARHSIFWLFIIILIASFILSIVWVYYISANGFTGYHQSLNDGSNRQRFVANIRALELLRQHSLTLLWGFGDQLRQYLHADDPSSFIRYMGVRLVQPHNSIINPMLTMGVVPATLYFILVSELLNSYTYKKNAPFIIPYMINAMFLQALFEMNWLVLWIIIISLPQQKYMLRTFNLKIIILPTREKKRHLNTTHCID